MNSEYKWQNKTQYSLEKGGESWSIRLSANEGLLEEDEEGCRILEINTFPEKSFERPYNKTKLIENEKTITFKKNYLSGYKRKINAIVELIGDDGMDAICAGTIYLYNGEIKESYGAREWGMMNNSERFCQFLDGYFKTEGVSKNLKDIILNSNLPEKQKKAVKCLTEMKGGN